AVFGAFAGCLNIFLVLLLGAHGLTLLLDPRYRFRRIFWTWVGAAGAAILAAAPVVLTAASQSAQIGATRLSVVGYARSILVNQWFLGGTPTIYEGGPLGDGPGSQLWKYSCVLLAVGCWLVVAYGVCRRPSTPTPSDGPGLRPLLLCSLILPTSVLVAYAVLATPIYNPRYLTYSAPALALLLGLGLVRIERGWVRALAVLAIALCAIPVYVSQRSPFAKSGADWQMVARFVEQRRGP